ncbi:hypothetical protein DY000_02029523 [Brassica cretica]|uniref:Uncharacterized protein n=1 Tax=Brassica cretica TaxID=69181 RepID=A0ABQ7DH79_BRACR|nr:hypothetical protein DY000_02029523 [Brassica cretica]
MISFVVSQKKDPSLQVQLLEYDMRSSLLGKSLFKLFTFIISRFSDLDLVMVGRVRNVWKELLKRPVRPVNAAAAAAIIIIKGIVQGTNRAYLFAGDAQRDRAAELLGVPCVFKPHLSSKLGNE